MAALIISFLAFVIALVALWRGAPPINYEHGQQPDSFVLWNGGPAAAVIIEASGFVPVAGDDVWKPARVFGPEIIDVDERLWGKDEACRGALIRPQQRYHMMIGVNTSLKIKYRTKGFLGWLSPATLDIHGAM